MNKPIVTILLGTKFGRNGFPLRLITTTNASSCSSCGGQHRSFSLSNDKNTALLLLGKPGGGKGTISGKILKDFPSFHHFSSGDVLRQHVRNQTEIGKAAKNHMDAGNLVPDELMIRLVLEDCAAIATNNFLLDGFPRTIQQATALDRQLNVDLVINLDIPTETIVERISDRYVTGRRVFCNASPIFFNLLTFPSLFSQMDPCSLG